MQGKDSRPGHRFTTNAAFTTKVAAWPQRKQVEMGIADYSLVQTKYKNRELNLQKRVTFYTHDDVENCDQSLPRILTVQKRDVFHVNALIYEGKKIVQNSVNDLILVHVGYNQ